MAKEQSTTGRSNGESENITAEMLRLAPPFDELATCRKCGGQQVRSQFKSDAPGERIERTCERCGYCWPERCLDDQQVK